VVAWWVCHGGRWNLGLQTARLQHRLSVVRSRDANRLCEPFDLNVSGITLTLPPKQSQLLLPDDRALPGIRVGKAYITDDGSLVCILWSIMYLWWATFWVTDYVTEIDSTNSGGLQVPEPMDFSMKNYMSLMDQQNLLIKLVRPDIQVTLLYPRCYQICTGYACWSCNFLVTVGQDEFMWLYGLWHVIQKLLVVVKS
jgi:hypothetical protein